MIADTVSIAEFTQAGFHMSNAIKLGIPPRQILEICPADDALPQRRDEMLVGA